MCLSKVTWQAKSLSNTKSRDKWQIGYKIFIVEQDLIFSPYFNLMGRHQAYSKDAGYALDTGKIYKNRSVNIIPIYRGDYKSGFHIFPVAIAAQLFVSLNSMYHSNIFEVKYRKVSCIGEHGVHTKYPVDCVIAQEMKIVRCLSMEEIEKIFKDEEKIERTKVRRS